VLTVWVKVEIQPLGVFKDFHGEGSNYTDAYLEATGQVLAYLFNERARRVQRDPSEAT
jgi:hypothetical protein